MAADDKDQKTIMLELNPAQARVVHSAIMQFPLAMASPLYAAAIQVLEKIRTAVVETAKQPVPVKKED